MLETVVAQQTQGAFTFEVVVVDNNSTDETRNVVGEFAGRARIKYLFEGRQGRAYALNTGLEVIESPIYAIVDDDLILPSDYLSVVYSTFLQHKDVSFVGGKVLPLWKGNPPQWLTARHWAAIAMADYGPQKIYSDLSNPINLLAAAFRTDHVKKVGGYHQELGVSKNRIGGIEDVDLHRRLWQAGYKGLYNPDIFLYHKVELERLTKSYHRRWHTGHGRFYAIMRDEDFERSKARLFDVPSHLYRQAMGHAWGWLRQTLARDEAEAFWHECQLRFCWGFFQQRRAEYAAQRESGALAEALRFARSLLSSRTGRSGEAETPKK